MFDVENPVVVDEFWESYSSIDDYDYEYDDENAIIERAEDCANGNCKGCVIMEYCPVYRRNCK